MEITIKAITIKGSLALLKNKKEWERMHVDSNFNTIKIAQVKSTWKYTKDGNIESNTLEFPFPPKESQLTKFKKHLKKDMLKINGSIYCEDYEI
jgi:hypothetical protein